MAGLPPVLYRSESATIATLDAFLLMRCFGNVTPDALEASVPAHDRAIAVRPAGIFCLTVVDPSAAFPSEPTRRAMVEAGRKTNRSVRGSAVVLRGDGFWAGALRGALTTFLGLSSAMHVTRIFRHEEEAVDWLVAESGEPASRYRAPLLGLLDVMKDPGAAR